MSENRMLQVALFVFWPVIACLLMFCVALVCAACWLIIPFGVPTRDGNSWTLTFPWSKRDTVDRTGDAK